MNMLNKNLYSVIPNIQPVYVYKVNNKNVPQLVPFFFINQIAFAFTLLVMIIYGFSKYILPKYVKLFLIRLYIVI